MKHLIGYLWTMIKIQFRIPIAIFFTLGFPLIMMFAIMSTVGNIDLGNGYHFIDKYILMLVGLGIAPGALITFPQGLGANLENQSYKRLTYFGISTKMVVMGEVISYLVISVLTIFIEIAFAFFAYGLQIPSIGYLLAFLVQCLYCNIVLLLFGAVLTLVVKKTKVLLPLGMIFMFGNFIVTGVFGGSFDGLPDSFQTIGRALPLKYLMHDFVKIWFEDEMFNQKFLMLNTIWALVLCAALAGVVLWGNRKKKLNSY